MWILPILVVGAIAMAVASRSPRATAPASRQLPPPVPQGPPGVPGPISVLGEILRVGQTPPPTVILCAIAEAQAIGRNDLASDITQVFVAPLVYHQERERARAARSMNGQYERGSCAIARSPRHTAEMAPRPGSCAPLEPVVIPAPPRVNHAPPVLVPAPSVMQAPASTPLPSMPIPSMDDQITALLNADPRGFMDLVSRSGTFPAASHAPASLAATQPTTPSASPVAASPIVQPPEVVTPIQDVTGPGSPIVGVADDAWRDFIVRLGRESPQFSSSRHVGQFRQRRERLVELGIDPNTISGSVQAQRAALDADLADAHRHGIDGDVFAQHLGRSITLPGRESAETITLSGMLGVIQCAGLEGAVGWLERSGDRKRYPHTTQAFIHTNGVF